MDLVQQQSMLKQGLQDIAAGPIWDPGAVDEMFSAGMGAEVEIKVGGKTDVPEVGQRGHGISFGGRITALTDGRFTVTGPMQTGLEVNLGRTAVVSSDQADLVICEERWEPYDPGCFTHAGIDPEKKKFILVKSRQHFRAGFEPISRHIVLAAGPGVCSSNYGQFDFRNLTRPIYPLDPDATFKS